MPESKEATQFDALLTITQTINSHLKLDKVLESVMDVATQAMQVEASSLVLVDEETNELLFHVTEGVKAKIIKTIRMKAGEGIVGWVIQEGKPVLVNDVSKDPRFFKKADKKSGFTTKSILCVPMSTSKKCVGAIEVLNKENGEKFTKEDQEFLQAIANQAAIAIENAKLHEQIVKTERLAAIGQTVSGLAHCIKNILNGIQGGSYILDLGLKKEDFSSVDKGWSIVKKNNEFMKELVLDMLSYSKEREPEYETVNPNELVKSVYELMLQKGKEKGVELTFDPEEELPEVHIDPKGVKRTVLNLVSNAIDACEETKGANVHISVQSTDGKTFRIHVKDTGIGMPPEIQAKLFQVFFSTKGSKGTGLGLAVSYKIIKEHGGNITVESEKGKGTAFTITLPKKRTHKQLRR
ncbi:MAG: GAF domain-containing sensor histidine kinase [Candidatus Cloacimonetes bacterium]|nr:GAF domain-containing sensor histidine kinase [Candidatus Cloacimonadota bacterium]